MMARAKRHLGSDDDFVWILLLDVMERCADQTLIFDDDRRKASLPLRVPIFLFDPGKRKGYRSIIFILLADFFHARSIEVFTFRIRFESIVVFEEGVEFSE